jgi:hypothetical protein
MIAVDADPVSLLAPDVSTAFRVTVNEYIIPGSGKNGIGSRAMNEPGFPVSAPRLDPAAEICHVNPFESGAILNKEYCRVASTPRCNSAALPLISPRLFS